MYEKTLKMKKIKSICTILSFNQGLREIIRVSSSHLILLLGEKNYLVLLTVSDFEELWRQHKTTFFLKLEANLKKPKTHKQHPPSPTK